MAGNSARSSATLATLLLIQLVDLSANAFLPTRCSQACWTPLLRPRATATADHVSVRCRSDRRCKQALRAATTPGGASSTGGGKNGSSSITLTDEQIADMSGVLSRVMFIPGVPDFVKLNIVQSGMGQVAAAFNSDALSPEMKAQVKNALGDGMLSKELGANIAKLIAPQIDIPMLGKEQKEAVVANIVSFLLVQREEENFIYFAMKGTYEGTAKLAYTSGRGMIDMLAPFRSTQTRKELAQKLNRDIDIPFISEDIELSVIQAAVDTLGGLLVSRIPAGALEAAVASGQEGEVEEFFVTVLSSEVKVPFTSEQQRRDMAGQIVRGWLGSVDKEQVKKEQEEALRASEERARMRADVVKRAKDDSSTAVDFLKSQAPALQKFASQASGFMGSFMNSSAQETQKLFLKAGESGGGGGRGGGGGGGRGWFSGGDSGDEKETGPERGVDLRKRGMRKIIWFLLATGTSVALFKAASALARRRRRDARARHRSKYWSQFMSYARRA